MQGLVSESPLPRLELDISDNDIPRLLEKIADWRAPTGGLWMRRQPANSPFMSIYSIIFP